jgi:hypothetical protein
LHYLVRWYRLLAKTIGFRENQLQQVPYVRDLLL